MTTSVNLDFLEHQITRLKKELDKEVTINPSDLSSPEVLEINNKIDRLINAYIKLSLM